MLVSKFQSPGKETSRYQAGKYIVHTLGKDMLRENIKGCGGVTGFGYSSKWGRV